MAQDTMQTTSEGPIRTDLPKVCLVSSIPLTSLYSLHSQECKPSLSMPVGWLSTWVRDEENFMEKC